MHEIRRHGLIFLLIFSFSASALFSEKFLPKKIFYNIHESLFDTFTPFAKNEIDTTIAYYLNEGKLHSFRKIQGFPELGMLLLLFKDLHFFGNIKLLKIYYKTIDKNELVRKTVTEENLAELKDFIDGFVPWVIPPKNESL